LRIEGAIDDRSKKSSQACRGHDGSAHDREDAPERGVPLDKPPHLVGNHAHGGAGGVVLHARLNVQRSKDVFMERRDDQAAVKLVELPVRELQDLSFIQGEDADGARWSLPGRFAIVSVRYLFGWQAGETLERAIARQKDEQAKHVKTAR
jgi:hypothetical protein